MLKAQIPMVFINEISGLRICENIKLAIKFDVSN